MAGITWQTGTTNGRRWLDDRKRPRCSNGSAGQQETACSGLWGPACDQEGRKAGGWEAGRRGRGGGRRPPPGRCAGLPPGGDMCRVCCLLRAAGSDRAHAVCYLPLTVTCDMLCVCVCVVYCLPSVQCFLWTLDESPISLYLCSLCFDSVNHYGGIP